MRRDNTEASIRLRFQQLLPTLDERQRRLWAATEAGALGYGGVSLVARATGVSRRAIHAGLAELAAGVANSLPPGRVRRPGAGCKPLTQLQPGLREALEALVEPTCRGDPAAPLCWTCKGVLIVCA